MVQARGPRGPATAGAAQHVVKKTDWVYWWTAGGSNPRPLHCERSALPAELAAHPRSMLLLHSTKSGDRTLIAQFPEWRLSSHNSHKKLPTPQTTKNTSQIQFQPQPTLSPLHPHPLSCNQRRGAATILREAGGNLAPHPGAKKRNSAPSMTHREKSTPRSCGNLRQPHKK
jgi:hypothetical protein